MILSHSDGKPLKKIFISISVYWCVSVTCVKVSAEATWCRCQEPLSGSLLKKKPYTHNYEISLLQSWVSFGKDLCLESWLLFLAALQKRYIEGITWSSDKLGGCYSNAGERRRGLNENDSSRHREKGKYSRYDSSIFASSYISRI